MIISPIEIELPRAEDVRVTNDSLVVDLSDGRTIAVPLEWFPRLLHATPEERNNWRFIGERTWDSLGRDQRGYKC